MMASSSSGDDKISIDFKLYYDGAAQALTRTRTVFYTLTATVVVLFAFWFNEYYSIDYNRVAELRTGINCLRLHSDKFSGPLHQRTIAVRAESGCYEAFDYAHQEAYLPTPLDDSWAPTQGSITLTLSSYNDRLSHVEMRVFDDTSANLPLFGTHIDYDYLGFVSSPFLVFISLILRIHLRNEEECVRAAYERANDFPNKIDNKEANALLHRLQLFLSPRSNAVIAGILVFAGCIVQGLILYEDYETKQIGYDLLGHSEMKAILLVEGVFWALLLIIAIENIRLIKTVSGMIEKGASP